MAQVPRNTHSKSGLGPLAVDELAADSSQKLKQWRLAPNPCRCRLVPWFDNIFIP